ncbi:PKD domain-containing protein [Sediminitomix flava]|uniref:PKD domain-containing protein n=1 Tax=Sediminitomix flava TaxID=379075 RepID=A0A315ZFA0_SEDFL|nr:PKD domain-containing protein [Sediminitomix flava]PWJ44002.1 PKD domain-containing protein [Sediminitomix flava]
MRKKLTSSNIFNTSYLLKISIAALFLSGLSFTACEETEDSINEVVESDRVVKPIANFTFSNENPDSPYEVTFANASSDASSYAWDFGDGNTSTDESPVHTYTDPGIYDVKLTAADETDQSNSKIVSVTVLEIMLIADFTVTYSETKPLEVSFSNISENAVSYAWDFGDENTSTEESPVHEYATGGDYTVTLTATDILGETEMKEMVVSVSEGVIAEISLPSFESADNDELYASWHMSPNLGGKIQSSSSPVKSGNKAGKLPGDGSRMAYQLVEVRPNSEYNVTFYYTLKAGDGGNLNVAILGGHVEDLAGVEGATITASDFNDQTDANEYVRATVNFETGDNDHIAIYMTNSAVDARFDDFSIELVQ